MRSIKFVIRLVAMALVMSGPGVGSAWGHCDTAEGPVVKASRRALEQGDVRLALIWVRPQDETELRSLYQRVASIRARDEATRFVADRLFIETVVRLHRAGEGMPYTGVKWEDAPVDEGIALAESSLTSGSVTPVLRQVSERLHQSLESLHGNAMSTRQYEPGNVEAGRRYVEAYVRYLHQVEALFQLLHSRKGEPATNPAAHQHQ